MQNLYDMIVIGGGPAGYTAALYAARAGLRTVVLEKLLAGGQAALTGQIDNYPGFADGIDGPALGAAMRRGAERFGAESVFAEVVSATLTGTPKLVQTAGMEYRGRTVVIAAGASPRELGVPGEKEFQGRGVHYCAHCDGRFYAGKTVLVVGGGNSAAADALYLAGVAERITVVHRRDALRADQIYHAPLQQAENISFLWDCTVEAIFGGDQVSGARIRNLKTGECTETACDGVFISIGRTPETGFLGRQVELGPGGYINADESACTNIPGVFAAGDIRTKALRQLVTAASDGAAAAHAAGEYLAKR